MHQYQAISHPRSHRLLRAAHPFPAPLSCQKERKELRGPLASESCRRALHHYYAAAIVRPPSNLILRVATAAA
jgi:hypothetical protein